MRYAVKEVYYTLQGEGMNAGRAAVFLRFSGCNLWNGREEDRAKGPGSCSMWCDTHFVGTDGPRGGQFVSANALAAAVRTQWKVGSRSCPLVVCTGGEPLLQLDEALVDALHQNGFEVAVETNGTRMPPRGIDWLCVSPKANSQLLLRIGDELKLVYPQQGAEPEIFEDLDFRYFLLQPMDGPRREEHAQHALRYCLEHPRWRLTLQIHKYLGLP